MIPLEEVRQIIANALADKIEPLFTKDMRLTLVARHLTNLDCYIVVTNDHDAAKAAETIDREIARKDGGS